jgi:hypothetical protein
MKKDFLKVLHDTTSAIKQIIDLEDNIIGHVRIIFITTWSRHAQTKNLSYRQPKSFLFRIALSYTTFYFRRPYIVFAFSKFFFI